MRAAAVLLLLTCVDAMIERTGRHGSVHSSVSEGIRHLCVKFGGTGDSRVGDVHIRYEKDVSLGRLRTHVSCRAEYPPTPDDDNLDEDSQDDTFDSKQHFKMPMVAVSGALPLDFSYEATRSLARSATTGTDVSLACSLPAGLQAIAVGNVQTSEAGSGDDTLLQRTRATLQSLSCFHVAGPVNVEVISLMTSKRVRLKFGRGRTRFRCPLSLSTEFEVRPESPPAICPTSPAFSRAPHACRTTLDNQPGSEQPADFELGLRQHLDEDGARKLRARLLMPGRKAHSMWVEYQDAKIDEGGVWTAKATVPFGGPGANFKPEFSLRRAWTW